MPTVAKRQKKTPLAPTPPTQPVARGTDRHKSPRIAFHLPQEMLDAFGRLLASYPDPKPSDSAVLRHALEKLLRERGFWPVSPADQADPS